MVPGSSSFYVNQNHFYCLNSSKNCDLSKLADSFLQFVSKEEHICQFFQDLELRKLKRISMNKCDEFLNYPLMEIAKKNNDIREP